MTFLSEMLTATVDVDYVEASGDIIFENDVYRKFINVTLKDDVEMESSETFKLTLTSTSGGDYFNPNY